MSEKALKVLVGLVAVLVAAYAIAYAVGLLAGGGESGGALADALGRVSAESVQEVRIAGPLDTIVLARSGAAWTVNGFRADSASVARLWSALTETKVGDAVAENPANHARLGVAADSAWSLEFHSAGGDVTRLLVGRSGPIYPSLYARLPDEARVYLVTGDLRNVATQPASQWRDKSIVRVDTARVHQIVIERDGARYALRRGEDGWRVDGEPADSTAVLDLLTELADLQAYGFPPEAAGLGNNARTVLALGAQGDTLAHLTLGSHDGVDFRVRLEGSPIVYDLSSWRADRLAPTKAALAREEREDAG